MGANGPDDEDYVMTGSTENLVLGRLRHISGRVDQVVEDMSDLKHRMSSLEHAMNFVKREVNLSEETDAHGPGER
ncbi:MAG: hypothetical protein ACYCUY_06615 [Acidithiobacillus sp.]